MLDSLRRPFVENVAGTAENPPLIVKGHVGRKDRGRNDPKRMRIAAVRTVPVPVAAVTYGVS